jgi:hypothetical protein
VSLRGIREHDHASCPRALPGASCSLVRTSVPSRASGRGGRCRRRAGPFRRDPAGGRARSARRRRATGGPRKRHVHRRAPRSLARTDGFVRGLLRRLHDDRSVRIRGATSPRRSWSPECGAPAERGGERGNDRCDDERSGKLARNREYRTPRCTVLSGVRG